MHETFEFLRKACGGVYHFAGGQVYCRDEALMAGAPSPVQSLLQESFNVPQGELEDLLRRRDEIQLSFAGALQVRGRGLSAEVQADRDEPPPVPAQPDGWAAAPDGMIRALEMASCFTEDGARWTAGIRLTDGRVTAICNTGGIDVRVPGLVGRPVLITTATADFLRDDPPAETATTDNALWARWPDGRWLRALLMNAEMPAAVDGIFEAAKGPATVVIDDAWREAFGDAAALTESSVELRAAGLRFAKGVGQGEVELATGLPDDHRSMWWAKVLAPVMKYAERWNPGGYPDPVLFEGDGFRGVVMGRR